MASRASFGKKEREKIKATKRIEKQKRKERNQSGGTRSFNDMIAYVDEYGVLHATQPIAEKVEVDISTIEIAVPKKEEVEDAFMSGKVEFFNSSKGFGFIKNSTSGEKYFFHISSAPESIEDGNMVTFKTEKTARGVVAINIEIK